MSSVLIRRMLAVSVMVMALLALAVPASAVATLTTVSVSCTSVTVSGTNQFSNGNDFSTLTITANGVTVYESSPFEFNPFEIDATIPLDLAPGLYDIVVTWDISPDSDYYVTTIACAEEPVEPLFGQICFGAGEVAAAVYIYPEEFEIYSIANDNGLLSIRLTSEALYTSPFSRGGDTLIAEAETVLPITLSRQSNGNFRVLVGPEPRENKVYECVFNAICSRTRSWVVGYEPSTMLDLSTCGQSLIENSLE